MIPAWNTMRILQEIISMKYDAVNAFAPNPTKGLRALGTPGRNAVPAPGFIYCFIER